MKKCRISAIVAASAALLSPLIAEEDASLATVPTVGDLLEQRKVEVSRHLPTTKKGAEASANNAQRAVAPQIQSTKLKKMRERALLVAKANASCQQQVSEGKLTHLAAFQHLYQQSFPETIKELNTLRTQHQTETNPMRKMQIERAIQTALTPVGAFLKDAKHRKADLSLTEEQAAEFQQLIEADRSSSETSQQSLQALSPQHTYTLLGVPFTIELIAPPGATIYLESHGGGKFANGMTIQKLTAGSQGRASSQWLSQGDSVGMCMITVSSPQCHNDLTLEAEVVGLELKPLPTFTSK